MVTVLLGSMLGVVGGAAIAVANILARVWSACICWEPISAKGMAGAVCWRALVKAAAASRTASMEDVLGIGVLWEKIRRYLRLVLLWFWLHVLGSTGSVLGRILDTNLRLRVVPRSLVCLIFRG